MTSNLCSQERICLSLELNFGFAVTLADSEIPCWLPEEDSAHWLRENLAPSLLRLPFCFLQIPACLSWCSYSWWLLTATLQEAPLPAEFTVTGTVGLGNFCLCYLRQHSTKACEVHCKLSPAICFEAQEPSLPVEIWGCVCYSVR